MIQYSDWNETLNRSKWTSKPVNEDPASFNVGCHRRSNQPNLKSKTMTSQRLLQGWRNVLQRETRLKFFLYSIQCKLLLEKFRGIFGQGSFLPDLSDSLRFGMEIVSQIFMCIARYLLRHCNVWLLSQNVLPLHFLAICIKLLNVIELCLI